MVSPEFEITLYTLVFLMGYDAASITLGGDDVIISCHRMARRIGSCYPKVPYARKWSYCLCCWTYNLFSKWHFQDCSFELGGFFFIFIQIILVQTTSRKCNAQMWAFYGSKPASSANVNTRLLYKKVVFWSQLITHQFS